MNNNSKLTEEYRIEITNILAKISSGLGESVITKIEPKIEEILTRVTENNKTYITIEEKISNINEEQSTLKETIETNSKNSDNKLTEVIQSNIDKQNNIINYSIKENSELVVSNNKITTDSILSKIESVSNRIAKLENDNTFDLHIIETKNTNKLIYVIIGMIIAVLGITISLFFKS